MKTQLILLSFVIVGLCAKAQTIEKFSIDNGGASVTNGNTQILYTIGEVNVQETVMGNILLSEGFINPAGNGETLSTNHGVLSENIKVFPNPASETLNISSSIKIEEVSLYNILGKKILETSNTNQINVSKYENGIYLLKIKTSIGEKTFKVIIKK